MAQRERNRTLEMYKKVGAEARLLKMVFAKFYVDAANIAQSSVSGKLFTIDRKITEAVSELENLMFKDFPNISNDYCDVFYGTLEHHNLVTDVDKEEYRTAIGLLKEMLGVEVKQNV